MINQVFLSYFLQLVFVAIGSFFLACIIKFEASLQVKIIVCGAFFLGILILIELIQVCKNQGTALYFLRNIYISVETDRLQPGNQEPSREILHKNLDLEKTEKEIYKAAGGILGYSLAIITWCIYLLGTIGFTYFILTHWNYIINSLTMGST